MKKFLALSPLLFLAPLLNAQYTCQETRAFRSAPAVANLDNNGKSDTVDIQSYELNLDLTALPQVSGKADIQLEAKLNNVNGFTLDLLEFQIDSVKFNGLPVTYTYNDTLLRISPPAALQPGTSHTVRVVYQGVPQVDASGWGGFHQSGPYAFVLGVGFAADPHTYGRSWHPCFDNFREKATYAFHVLTPPTRRATANGAFLGTDTLSGNIRWNYALNEEIPAYLAAIASADYVLWERSASLEAGQLPIQVFARAQDTVAVNGSFQNMEAIAQALEHAFGTYKWERIGYALTTQGAMEHPTCVHYPRNLVNGQTTYEEIIAHELAHHWWGDYVTCATAEDMWINEGMAEFSSHLYREELYGREDYLNTVKANLAHVLRQAHIADNGFRAISNIPHAYTYGEHVYQKGALVAHNLRGYLGDSLFFGGTETLLNNNAFGNLTTADFEAQLSAITGVNLTPFFDAWVNSPGFADFYVDSLFSQPGAVLYLNTLRVRQGLYGTNQLHQDVPLTVDLLGAGGLSETFSFTATGTTTTVQFTTPFPVIHAVVNRDQNLLLGCLAGEATVYQTGSVPLAFGDLQLTATQVGDSARVRVEHHFAPPAGEASGFRLSSTNFWRVLLLEPGQPFQATANLVYDGRVNAGYLDLDLTQNGEDSLVLLHRSQPWEPWTEYPHYVKNIQISSTNRIGRMELSQVLPGDYALANGVSAFGVAEVPEPEWILVPNPANSTVTIRWSAPHESTRAEVIDTLGRTVLKLDLPEDQTEVSLSVAQLPTGSYTLRIGESSRILQVQH